MDVDRVRGALQWLVDNNPLYSDVKISLEDAKVCVACLFSFVSSLFCFVLCCFVLLCSFLLPCAQDLVNSYVRNDPPPAADAEAVDADPPTRLMALVKMVPANSRSSWSLLISDRDSRLWMTNQVMNTEWLCPMTTGFRTPPFMTP